LIYRGPQLLASAVVFSAGLAAVLFPLLPPGSAGLFRTLYIGASAAALGLLIWGWRPAIGKAWSDPAQPRPRGAGRLALGLGLGWLALGFGVRAYLEPSGMWDATGFWNAKARAYAAMFQAGEAFRWSEPSWIHPGYPAALPLGLGGLAVVLGSWHALLPIAFHFVLLIAAGALFFYIAWLKPGEAVGWRLIYASALLPQVYVSASDLAGDFPLCFALLASVAIAVRIRERLADGYEYALLGALAGYMLHCKNEGFALAGLALTLGLFAVGRQWRGRWRELTACVGVFAGAVVLLFLYKGAVFNPEPMPGGAAEILARLLTPERYLAPLKALAGFHLLALLGLALLWILHVRPRSGLWMLAPFAGIQALYLLFFVATSYDQSWHITTAHNRINFVVFPAFAALAAYLSGDETAPTSSR
jgi:hypothetical protein